MATTKRKKPYFEAKRLESFDTYLGKEAKNVSPVSLLFNLKQHFSAKPAHPSGDGTDSIDIKKLGLIYFFLFFSFCWRTLRGGGISECASERSAQFEHLNMLH
jgi:hypothetical protein